MQTGSGDQLLSELHLIIISARYILGKKNVLADQLSHLGQVLPVEWFLLPQVFGDICREFGLPLINLFATLSNLKLFICLSPVPDPMVWKDAFQHPKDNLNVYAFSPFALLSHVLLRLMLFLSLSMILVAPLWPPEEWGLYLLVPHVVEPTGAVTCERVSRGWISYTYLHGNYQAT